MITLENEILRFLNDARRGYVFFDNDFLKKAKKKLGEGCQKR